MTATLPINILHLEDQPEDVELCRRYLESAQLAVNPKRVQSRAEFEICLETEEFDIILSDFTLPAFDGISALEIACKICPQVPFLFYSGTLGEEAAVDALKRGACDYVVKQRPLRLAAAVRRALQEAAQRRERQQAEQALRASERLAHRHLAELELVYRQAPVGLGLLGSDLRFLNLNERLAEMFGRPPRHLLGNSLKQLFPDLALKLNPVFQRILQGSRPVENFDLGGIRFHYPHAPRHWRASIRLYKSPEGLSSGLNIAFFEC